MDALMGLAVLVALLTMATLLWRMRRSRSDQRLQWQGTRDRDWTTEELDVLRAGEVTDALA